MMTQSIHKRLNCRHTTRRACPDPLMDARVIVACLAAILALTLSGCSGAAAHAVDSSRAATRWWRP